LALLFFNLGVEAGQLTFIAAVLTIMFAWKRLAPAALNTRLGDYSWRAPVYVIGITSAFWLIQRTAVVLGL
ncbi:MAG: HupE/UreJ family protein, partial [Hyphomonadaceae bacterium]